MRQLTEIERQEFLAQPHVAVLTVAADNGRPPAAVPIWYDYEPGGDIRISTTAARRKARLLQKSGVVTLVVQRSEPPYKYVVVEGTVVDAEEPAPSAAREAIAVRYLGAAAGRGFAQSSDGKGQVLFTIRPERWFSTDYGDPG